MHWVLYKDIHLAIPDSFAIPQLLSRFEKNSYEAEELSIVPNFSSTDTVLELGSCIGFLTHILANRVDRIVGIEANPLLIASLQESVIRNKKKNISIDHCILDKYSTTKIFHTYDLVVAGSADRDDYQNPDHIWGKGKQEHIVTCKTIESIEQQYSISFNSLVVDIEGGELLFFEQNKEYIRNNINKIIVELHGRFMKDKSFNQKCITLLLECGLIIKKQVGNTYFFAR